MPDPARSFAYLFERFPSFVQTFVHREAAEMVRQKMAPLLISIRRPDDPDEFAGDVNLEVFYPPEEKRLRDEVDARRAAREVSWRARRAIPRRRTEPDSQRMFEAIWLAPVLRGHGIEHIHAHFGGLAARTAWWLKKLFGFTFSFTGHANDIFCETDFPVSNAGLARAAKFVVTETGCAQRWFEERHPFARGKVHHVFNGIDPAGFFPREPAPDVPFIVSVGRCVEKKGFDVLIDACANVLAAGQPLRCEIVGDGPLRDSLQAQIDRLQIGDHVRLTGSRSQSEVRRLFSRATVFVLACQPDSEGGSDNLPTVVAEAMMAGVPVISTTVAGVPEMIADGRDGILVPPRDAAALSAAIERLLTHAKVAEELSQTAIRTAREKFAVENTTRQLKHLLVRHGKITPPRSAFEFDPALRRKGLFSWR